MLDEPIVLVSDSDFNVCYLSKNVNSAWSIDSNDLIRKSQLTLYTNQSDILDFIASCKDAETDKSYSEQFVFHLKTGLTRTYSQAIQFIPSNSCSRAIFVTKITPFNKNSYILRNGDSKIDQTIGLESQHRIFNNLQAIINLLRIQSNKFPEASGVIRQCVLQISAVSSIHQLLSNTIDQKIEVDKLIALIAKSNDVLFGITTNVAQPPIKVFIKEKNALQVSLIINELLINASKNTTQIDGIQVSFEVDEKFTLKIIVSNPGFISLSKNDYDKKSSHMGMQLIHSLLPKKGAEFSLIETTDEVQAVLTLNSEIIFFETESNQYV